MMLTIFIQWQNWNENSEKLVSNVHIINPQKITVDKNWFDQVTLSLTDVNATLERLSAADVTKYEDQIKTLFSAANGNTDQLFNHVEIKYTFESQTDLDASNLVSAITTALNDFSRPDKGLFTLWDGNEGSVRIKVYFKLKTSAQDDFILVNSQGNPIADEADRSGDLKSNIKTEIDLSDYFNQLLNNPLQAVKGNQNGSLQSFEMPNAISGRLNGLTYEQIKNIVNPLGLDFQFKENQNNAWSNWVTKEQIQNYDPQDPAIMVGLNITANAKIKVLVNQIVVDDTYQGIKAKLNLPKLVKLPTDEQQMIDQYNQLNIFGGNTFELTLTNPEQGLKVVADALIAASATAASQTEYEELKNNGNLILKFKLGTTGWFEANQLQTHLSTQQSDQNSNALQMKVELSAPAASKFILDPALANKEFNLLANNNETIKKWIHGTAYENVLNSTSAVTLRAGSNKNNLQYEYHSALQELFSSTGRDGLVVQWRLGSEDNTTGWKNLKGTNNQLPSQVAPSEAEILIRIAKDPASNVYLYGPEQKATRHEFRLDLSQIPTQIQIDRTWLESNPFVATITDSKNIQVDQIKAWEAAIWNKIPEAADNSIKNKLVIKYEFARHSGLTADNLFDTINAELSKFDNSEHHGIVKLHDKNQQGNQNGYKIKATFEKVTSGDQDIQFVDMQGNNIDADTNKDQRSGIVDTSNITTTIDMSAWIKTLIEQKTNVTSNNGAGTIQSLTPPVLNGAPTSNLFAGQDFNNVESWLKKAGISLWWTKEATGNRNWQATNAIQEYDATKAQLWFALDNQSSNLILNLGNNLTIPTLNPHNDNKAQPLTINLNAPKLINVRPLDAADLEDAFSGNTKYLNVNTTKIQTKINDLLARQGNQFTNAPLTLLVQVGNETFVDYKELASTLAAKTNDVISGLVKVKFAIRDPQTNSQEWQIINDGEDELNLITDPSTIKVFINDQGIFNDLKTQTRLEGNDNTNFQFVWPNGWTVDQNGFLSAQNKGEGLRLEFSFTDLDPANGSVGSDINTQWVSIPPTSYTLDKKQIYIRLQTQANYVYERIESNNAASPVNPKNQDYKFSLALNLPLSIELDRNWLDQPFANQTIQLSAIKPADFDFYENAVQQQINHPDDIKTKIAIRYIFNGDNTNKLTKDELIAKFVEYQKQTNEINNNFGFLKLWNGSAGIKISTIFVKADETDDSYNFTWKNNQDTPIDLNTEKVQTTIDLTSVVQWLETTKVQFNPGNQANTITSLIFANQPVSASGSPFDGKTWAQVEQVLEALNIQVEYLPVYTNSDINDWKQSADEITQYDNRGIFQIRFRLEANKAKNLVINFKNGTSLVGSSSDVISTSSDVQLKIVRKIVINSQTVQNNFINNAQAITGNTKFLQIDAAIEKVLIKAIEKDNNDALPPGSQPVFNDTNLNVLYAIGNSTTWKNRTDFINELKKSGVGDQISNLIKFKFVIETPQGQEAEFNVDANEYQFNQNDNSGQKIKFFIHTGNLEDQADRIMVNGTTNALKWDFSAFGTNKIEENANQVYLKTAAGNLLQLHFTTNSSAAYNDPTIGNANELATKWIKIKPTSIGPTDRLFVRISPIHSGIVYEAAGDQASGISPSARVHEVQLTITQVVRVNKQWFDSIKITNNEIEIQAFNEQLLNGWIERLKTEIKQLNQLPNGPATEQLLRKINLEFSLDGQGNYNVQQLVAAIKQKLADYSSSELGIIQLWNSQNQRGLKVGVKFISANSQEVTLEEINNEDLTQTTVLDTNNVYTIIDLSVYISVLKSQKTTVTPKTGGRPEQIDAFLPPVGKDATGFLNDKTYDEIAGRLNQVGIQIFFATEPNAADNAWKPKDQIKAYNPQYNKLYWSITNEPNNNLKIKLDANNTINANTNSRKIEIGLPLAVPRQINIDVNADLTNLAQLMNFGGDTKNITYDKTGANTIIEQILQNNANHNNGDNDYLSAPLSLKFQVGNTEFQAVDQDQLKTFLSQNSDDLTSREIRWKFDLDNADPNQWIFNPDATGIEGALHLDNNSSPIKIYINDKGLFEDLKKPNLDGSTSDALHLDWSAKKIKIDLNNGTVNATEINGNKPRGVGLKLEFTYLKNLNGADGETINIDPFKGWSQKVPTSFDANISTELGIRVRLIDQDKYVYDQINQKFVIDLSQIPTVIKLDGNWLKQSFSTSAIDLSNLNKTHFEAYEKLVWTQAALGPVDAKGVKIAYNFDNNDYTNLDDLIRAIQDYQNQHAADVNLGILQLWNNVNSGVKITSKFVKVNESDPLYILNIKNQNQFDLDLSKIITTIDFSAVLEWLKNQTIEIEGNEANQTITKLKIPAVDAPGSLFNSKSWEIVTQILNTFGLTIEYSNNLQNNQPNWGSIGNVDRYDPAKPSFQLRFKTDGSKSTNIKLQLANNQFLDGQTPAVSAAEIIKIKARLLVQINPDLLTEFENSAIFAGDTKNLDITNVTNPNNQLIQKIINANLANDSRYEELLTANLLEIQYVLQKDKPDDQVNWQDLNGLVTFLKSQDHDQNTNQIWYRINLKPTANFNLNAQDMQPKILSTHEAPTSNTKIKYYVNAATWETQADQIEVSGSTNQLLWNFNQIFANSVTENQGKVYLNNVVGQALQVYFILDNQTADYNNPPGLSDNANEIKTKWVSIKPNQIAVGTKSIKIKLVANAGFVYGPAIVTPQSAKAHDVEINVKNVLYVDKTWLAEALVNQQREISSLNKTDFDNWEAQIYQKIKDLNKLQDDAIARKVKIKYTIGNDSTKLDAQGFLDEIQKLKMAYDNPKTLGVVQLWNTTSQRGLKVEAHFELEQAAQNDYLLQINGNANPGPDDLKNQVNTDHVYTSVSLVEYIKVLKQEKTQVVPKSGGKPGEIESFTPPQMSGTIGQGFLNGYSFEEISAHLQTIGIQIKFAQSASNQATDWMEKDQIKAYNPQTSVLFLSFEIDANAQNLKVQWDNTNTLEPGQNLYGTNAIKLPLDVPKYIIINPNASFWIQNKDRFNFRNNTKQIEFDQGAIDQFIQEILDENFTNSGGDLEYKNAPLKIEFQIGNLAFVEISKLKEYLANWPDDLENRSINFKFSIPESESKKWQLDRPTDTYTLLVESDPQIKKLKIYINDKNIFNDLQATQLGGTNDHLQWKFVGGINVNPNDGTLSAFNKGKGLKVEFTFNENAAQNAAPGTDIKTEWVSQMPTSFDINQTKVFIRLALVDEDLYFYEQKYKKIELSLENILLVLKLQSAWLKLIQLSGNTKNLVINENAAQAQLNSALPQGQPNLVKFKYSIDEQNWYDQAEFIAFLVEKDGQKDANNFILKRSEIKVRFELDATKTDKYQMVIDNTEIQPDNSNNPSTQLIDEQTNLNNGVRGYIELKHLKDFVVDTFAIKGTNSAPKLIIKKKTELETLMQNYASDQLFDILITSRQNADGSWDFSQNISLLKSGNKFISDAELIAKNFTLGPDKKVALRFKSKDANYDVYKDGTKHNDGYDLDISQNVQITFEIENPFVKKQKTLALWWTADNDKIQGKYFQGEGGFKVVNGDLNGNPDVNNFMAANEWMQSTQSDLSDKEKSVLEFVYYVYDGEPDEQAINDAQSTITNYQDSKWQKLADVLEAGNTNFTNDLGLKVGQYVSVALRVKQEYASGNDVYALKDNQHSFIRPISPDGQTKLGRVHGYKIKTAALEIDEKELTLENMLNSEQAPLDGYTNIKRLNLVKDEKENYQGVDLELQLFHQFHKGQNKEEVIITPFDKMKLIKRQQGNIAPTEYFKNADGQNILDDAGNPIPILLDAKGRPQAPEEVSSATFSEKFTRYGEGFFGLTVPLNDVNLRNKWGIFKNESVKVVFSAYQGEGGVQEPDFILDGSKTIDLKDIISSQIKFPIFNQENIKYEFNQTDFSKENVEFESSAADQNVPIDGKSKVKTLIKLIKTSSAISGDQIIEGKTAEETVNNLQNELKTSFQNKLQFETIYEKIDGGTEIKPGLELYKLTSLKNNDRIKVRIVSADSDFIWAEPPKALTIHVRGLTAKAPNPNKLQFLRVEQSGQINGQGAFKVLINDPQNSNSDPNEILEGWKFVLRVWNNNKQIKQDWTDDQSKIVNLENGDKIEWKLVDQFDNPISDPYYNTVAGEHRLNPDGSTKLIFTEVNYPQGINSAEVVKEGVGQYPSDPEAYPENSGFVVSGLKEQFEIFEISEKSFTKVINKLEPHYVGVNGQGRINFNATYLDNNYL